MKATEIMKLIELGQTFKQPKDTRRRQKLEKEFSITDLLHKELEKSQALTKLLKDYETANKKEEKKHEGWTTPQIAMLLTFITVPAYVLLTLMLIRGH
jgi:hypothetical protein